MAKAKNPAYRLPAGVASFPHLLRPDTEAPKNASFKPDNKYKITVTFDSPDAVSALDEAVRDLATEKWGKVDFESFNFPFKHHDEDAKKDYLKNKTTLTAKSQYQPQMVDARKNALPVIPEGKDKLPPGSVEIRGGDIVRVAITLYFYEKVEKVRDAKTKKTEDILTRGASAQLVGVQLISRRAGVFGGDMFDEEEGFDASNETASAATSAANEDGDGDF